MMGALRAAAPIITVLMLLVSLLRGHTLADWNKIGWAKNLAVSELVPDADAWTARHLQVLPPQVAAVNDAFADASVRTTQA